MKVTIIWSHYRTWVDLFQKGKRVALFGLSHRGPLAFLGPDGTYLEFPVQEGEVELDLPIDLRSFTINQEIAKESLMFFRPLTYHDRAWLFFPESDSSPLQAEIRLRIFGVRIVNRDPDVRDLHGIARLIKLPERLLAEVRRQAKQALGYVNVQTSYRFNREMALHDLVRLLSGHVPPLLWFTPHQLPQVVKDPVIYDLVLEAERIVLLGRATRPEGGTQ